MPMTREEIEKARAAAMASKPPQPVRSAPAAALAGRAATGAPSLPNQSRLTLARAAIRPEMKGRVMLSGPAGAGKTYTAHVIATTLVGPGGRILTIDSEKESSLTYADVFTFDHLRWNPPFDPTALSLTLKEAQSSYDAVIIDSFSHWWRKQGGVLDIAGDNVRGWKSARPIQEDLIETLLDVDMHVIVCCRSKMEHLIEERGGKMTVTKMGIKAQQDDDLEYEVNVALEVDMPHVLHVVKSRTNAVPVGAQYLAGLAGDFAQQYREWLAAGEEVAAKEDTDALRDAIRSIEDDGLRSRAIGEFLDVFGRPEFLLVSRLAEARQWVADVVAGTLPVDRAEDETPPDPQPGASAPVGPSEASKQGETPPEPAAPVSVDPGASGDEPHADSIQHDASVDGPEVFNGDTGHCRDCGGAVWYDVDRWRHAEETDVSICPSVDGDHWVVTPTPADMPTPELDAIYARAHMPAETGQLDAAQRAEVEAQVKAMTPTQILTALRDAKLSIQGTPKRNRERWLEHRLSVALADAS